MSKIFLLLGLMCLSTILSAQQSTVIMAMPKEIIDDATFYSFAYGAMSDATEEAASYTTHFSVFKLVYDDKNEYGAILGYESSIWFNIKAITLYIDDTSISLDLDKNNVEHERSDSDGHIEMVTIDISDGELIDKLLKAKTFRYQYKGQGGKIDIVMSNKDLSQFKKELKKLKSAQK